MNALFFSRLTRVVVWCGVFAAFLLLQQHQLDGDALLALIVTAGLIATLKLGLLLVFRNQPANMEERLTTLGGLLAGQYGPKE